MAVRVWVTLRLSRSPGVRCTRPRASSPSTTAVTVGRRTVRRSASAEGIETPSASSPRTRYCGQGQLDVGEGQLDLLGEPGRGATQGPGLVRAARPRSALFSGGERHVVRLSNESDPPVRARSAGPIGPGH